MKIVVLDGHTMNPGDLDWVPLRELGCCVIYARTTPDELVDRAQDAEIILTNKTVLSAAILEQLPTLKYIGILATGVNVVDLEAAAARDIVVTNIPGYSTNSVAQMVFALLLEMTQQVALHAEMVRQGEWASCADFSFTAQPILELAGKTMGIVGYGQIGQQVANIATAFGMKVILQTAHPEKYMGEAASQFVDIDTLFADADIISLNCPLTAETENMVNTARLARVKQGALLINTGRGQLIDETAVAEALEEGYNSPNCIITPHIAWATVAARQRLLDLVVANIVAFQAGDPQNLVN